RSWRFGIGTDAAPAATTTWKVSAAKNEAANTPSVPTENPPERPFRYACEAAAAAPVTGGIAFGLRSCRVRSSSSSGRNGSGAVTAPSAGGGLDVQRELGDAFLLHEVDQRDHLAVARALVGGDDRLQVL